MSISIVLTDAEVEDLLSLIKDQEELKPLADKLKTKVPSVAAQAKFKLGATSLTRLKGVHPDLVKVVKRAIELTPIDFTVLEGLRTKERQVQLVAKGASKTMNSRHITGDAVDIAPLVDGKVTWDWKYYNQLAPIIKQAAKELGVTVEWGGDWQSFRDGPHWQRPR